jgi:hypothetical protein
MPARMVLRSGPDWHLDAGGTDTFVAFLDATGVASPPGTPIGIALYLDYADWFVPTKQLPIRSERVTDVTRLGSRAVAAVCFAA